MKRALISQMKNEWASNLWLVIELAIVTSAILYLSWFLGVKIYSYTRHQPVQIDNVYVAEIRNISPDSPIYVDMGEEAGGNYGADLLTLVSRLRELDYVEAVAFGRNAAPYYYGCINLALFDIQDPDSIDINVNTRYVSTDYPKVFRLSSIDGKSPEQLSDILRKGEVIISIAEYTANQRKGDQTGLDLVGKEVKSKWSRGEDAPATVGAIIPTIRRTNFEYDPWCGTQLVPLDENPSGAQASQMVMIRVKPGKGADLTDDFYSSPQLRLLRNVSLLNLRPLTRDRDSTQDLETRQMRLSIAQIILLLCIVFLGLLGTFWFRVQGRTGEIALRKVCGASPLQISRRLLGEGAILLTASLLPVAIFAAWIIPSLKESALESYFYYNDSVKIMWISFAAGVAIMYLLVIIGIWFPMRRAMKIRPAVALKQE